ncbi:MAG: hypothetical protein K9J30_08670 [Bacteroidales bacterium]|nr:hypothetical protein [Bacteroidales bacterium]
MKNVVITGSSRGIGYGLALEYLKGGSCFGSFGSRFGELTSSLRNRSIMLGAYLDTLNLTISHPNQPVPDYFR